MSNETKRDVFEDALRALEDFGEQGSSWEMAYDDLSARYSAASDAALPDDLLVIPKAVSEYIQEHKAAHDSLAFALTARWIPKEVGDWMFMVAGDSDTELSQIEYVKQQDTFARAWVLGVWRVDGTGEIVKLEERDD